MAQFLPSTDRDYLTDKGHQFQEVEDGAQKAVILKAVPIPGERLEPGVADILILLPTGYPDAAPDMFHTTPWLKLRGQGVYPNRADQPVSFGGISWQRWSRHNSDWRAGIDGIQTMIARVMHAMETAAP